MNYFCFQILVLAGLSTVAVSYADDFPPDTFPPESGTSQPQTYEESEMQEGEKDLYLSPKKRRKLPKKPKPSAVIKEPVIKQAIEEPATTAPAEPENPYAFRYVSLTFGLSKLSSNEATNESFRQTHLLKDHFQIGMKGDYQLTRVFGVELEGYYATTPSQEIEQLDSTIHTHAIYQSGALFFIRAQYPLTSGNWVWRPRLGLGFGLSAIGETVIKPTTTTTADLALSGVAFDLGLEVDVTKSLLIFADYAFSVGASGSVTKVDAAPSTTLSLNGNFSRLRLGASYKTFWRMAFGPLLVLRQISADTSPLTPIGVGGTETSLQLLLLGSIHF